MNKRKIAVITGTRATYGYSKRLMKLMEKSKKLELKLIVTGMHLLKEYGLSVNEIIRDGLPITARVDMAVGGDTGSAWAKSLGVEIEGIAQVFSMVKPDLVLVSGDRGEMLAATLAAVYMNLPVAHLQSGDVSGHIDGSARHAITKLCHIHFPACDDSARRVEKLGEEKWRIHNVGAPQLDEVVQGAKLSKGELEKKLAIDLSTPTLLVIQHPVLIEIGEARAQMIETMEAVKALGYQTLVIYPNVDAGGEEIIKVIKEYEKLPFVHSFRNIDRLVFLSLLEHISVLIGNSSCGILEAPSFRLPAINIGERQRGRMRACNVIDVKPDGQQIIKAVNKAMTDKKFRESLSKCVNPYGDGHSSERIVKILEEVELGASLLDKKITY